MKYLFTFVFLGFSILSLSQEFSVSVGPNWGVPFYYQFVAGGSGKSPQTGFTARIDFVKFNDKKISQGFGIGFQRSNVKITPAYTGGNEKREAHIESDNIIYLAYKMVFRKRNTSYLSLNPLLGFQIGDANSNSFDKQTGLGISFNYAKKIYLNEDEFLKIEPELNVFNIVPFGSRNLPERLTSVGINIGFGRTY